MSAANSEQRIAGWRTWPGYVLLTLLSLATRLLPGRLAYAAAYVPAWVIYRLTLHREPRLNAKRRGVQRNMRIAFGDGLTAAELRRLTWRYALHLAWVGVELLRLPRLNARRAAKAVDAREIEPVLELLRQGQGVICATGHFGNWEVFGVASATWVGSLTTLVRPIPEPGVDRWINGARAATGQHVRAKRGGLWTLAQAIRDGGGVGLNVDENMRKNGVFVPFCGVLAATNPSAYRLQRRTAAPIAVVTCHRTAPGRFHLKLWDLIQPEAVDGEEAPESAVIGRIAHGFERALAHTPEQWLWGLRRWATRPQGEPEGELPPRVGEPLQLVGP